MELTAEGDEVPHRVEQLTKSSHMTSIFCSMELVNCWERSTACTWSLYVARAAASGANLLPPEVAFEPEPGPRNLCTATIAIETSRKVLNVWTSRCAARAEGATPPHMSGVADPGHNCERRRCADFGTVDSGAGLLTDTLRNGVHSPLGLLWDDRGCGAGSGIGLLQDARCRRDCGATVPPPTLNTLLVSIGTWGTKTPDKPLVGMAAKATRGRAL
mmetsp:Transcript_66118/g.166743  ORF Transcript_66118/g.166743 Transcript_66118/m.166743 type:complete len:216 (+) Transcript_66118:452-1099(+)